MKRRMQSRSSREEAKKHMGKVDYYESLICPPTSLLLAPERDELTKNAPFQKEVSPVARALRATTQNNDNYDDKW